MKEGVASRDNFFSNTKNTLQQVPTSFTNKFPNCRCSKSQIISKRGGRPDQSKENQGSPHATIQQESSRQALLEKSSNIASPEVVVYTNNKLDAFRQKLDKPHENKLKLQERLGIVEDKYKKTASTSILVSPKVTSTAGGSFR
ncbi:hypothetical protein FGO68_gene5129 [Halteria grandinella]|uniref:Uncharacterized protein n=1 Tax=Halteria grandinella TaxID=5974 RepID=A0A8J8P2A4_HALGN|nr:hypothetical protein FGO68_gene5129 [Halteria grandinella]